MFTEHPMFDAPADLSVPIWRYMDLPKLVSILLKEAVFFPSADRLGDPFEGSYPAANIDLRPGWYGRDAEFEHLRMERRRRLRTTLVSCWHMNPVESAAMWKLYARDGAGIAVRSTYARLTRCFHTRRPVYHHGSRTCTTYLVHSPNGHTGPVVDEHRPGGDIAVPGSRSAFERRFVSEAACRAYLVRVRWPNGFVCPARACGGRRAWLTARGLYRCAVCGRQSSATAGTILARTHAPLRAWFEVLWLLAGENGVSAAALRVALGLGSYQTAWAWLHKLRRTLAVAAPEPLSGVVELAVMYLHVGGYLATVAIAVEARDGDMGRLRLARLARPTPPAIERFVAQAVAAQATPRTYPRHPAIAFPGGLDVGLPHLERAASELEEWRMRTHGGAIGTRQLDFYLDEFAFRFNHRADPQGLRFYRLLEAALTCGPRPARSLVGGPRWGPPGWELPDGLAVADPGLDARPHRSARGDKGSALGS